jgi:hypothetical protein
MKHLLLAVLLAAAVPALAQPTPTVKTDTAPQPTTANDAAVTAGTNVQTARSGEDNPPAGPEKPAGTIAGAAPKTPTVPVTPR